MKRDFVILFIELFCVQASLFLGALLQEYALFCQIMLLFFLALTYRRIYLLARRSLKNAQEEEKFQALQKQEQLQKEQEQQNRTDHVVSGFAFYSEKDARLAEQERQKIAYLDKRIDRTNLESVLVIYKKALDDRVFRTPVGLEYLRELQGELKAEQDLLGEEIPPIPLWTNFADTREKTSPARRRIKPAPEENKNTTFRLSLIMNIVMVIAIIAMFIITLNSDQPNVLNYERNLQNKYATWEQELTQREQTVREKERELHIETEVSQN